MYYTRTSLTKPQKSFAILAEKLNEMDVVFLKENGYHLRKKPNSKGQQIICNSFEELTNEDRGLFDSFR